LHPLALSPQAARQLGEEAESKREACSHGLVQLSESYTDWLG